MKLNVGKPLSKSRVRLPIVITILPTLVITALVINNFPDFVDRMSRTLENSELNGALNETGQTSSLEVVIALAGIIVAVFLWVYLIRSIKSYRRHYLYDDQKLIREKKYSKLFRTWLND